MTFWSQVRRTADKRTMMMRNLSRLMANIAGPSANKRWILVVTVQSVLLYSAELWADTLKKESYRRRLIQVQGRTALWVASAYRIPVTFLAKERRRLYFRKKNGEAKSIVSEERARTITEWQTTWQEEGRGRWTNRLIQHLKPKKEHEP
ncbi:hypothetical protein QE152_g6406 [Popillia japonica]|uniref:Uncharacterized protein n=1 Tax=Popillia japonica TaxID=7064 RepID=A0AAW1MJ43_POPJA